MNKLKYPLICLLLFSAAGAYAENDPIAKIGWKKIKDLDASEMIEKLDGSQTPIALIAIKEPPVTDRNHAIGGEIRYRNVTKDGFMEMWSYYRENGPYFSRTLGKSGPTGKLSGDSEWRPVLMPFFGDGKSLPTKLEVNIILPGGGEVEFRNLGLYQLSGDRIGKVWWSDYTGNMVGAICGSLIGVLGSVLGWLTVRGKARGFVLNTYRILTVLGGISAVAAIVAVAFRQPYMVWFPLALLGVLLVLIGPSRYRGARKSYLDRELRAISAADQ